MALNVDSKLLVVVGLVLAFAYFIFNFIRCHLAKPNIYESIEED